MKVSPYGKRKFIYSVDCNHLTKVNISEIEREREKTQEITLEKKEKTKEELFDQLRPAGECPFKKNQVHFCCNSLLFKWERERDRERERRGVHVPVCIGGSTFVWVPQPLSPSAAAAVAAVCLDTVDMSSVSPWLPHTASSAPCLNNNGIQIFSIFSKEILWHLRWQKYLNVL